MNEVESLEKIKLSDIVERRRQEMKTTVAKRRIKVLRMQPKKKRERGSDSEYSSDSSERAKQDKASVYTERTDFSEGQGVSFSNKKKIHI